MIARPATNDKHGWPDAARPVTNWAAHKRTNDNCCNSDSASSASSGYGDSCADAICCQDNHNKQQQQQQDNRRVSSCARNFGKEMTVQDAIAVCESATHTQFAWRCNTPALSACAPSQQQQHTSACDSGSAWSQSSAVQHTSPMTPLVTSPLACTTHRDSLQQSSSSPPHSPKLYALAAKAATTTDQEQQPERQQQQQQMQTRHPQQQQHLLLSTGRPHGMHAPLSSGHVQQQRQPLQQNLLLRQVHRQQQQQGQPQPAEWRNSQRTFSSAVAAGLVRAPAAAGQACANQIHFEGGQKQLLQQQQQQQQARCQNNNNLPNHSAHIKLCPEPVSWSSLLSGHAYYRLHDQRRHVHHANQQQTTIADRTLDTHQDAHQPPQTVAAAAAAAGVAGKQQANSYAHAARAQQIQTKRADNALLASPANSDQQQQQCTQTTNSCGHTRPRVPTATDRLGDVSVGANHDQQEYSKQQAPNLSQLGSPLQSQLEPLCQQHKHSSSDGVLVLVSSYARATNNQNINHDEHAQQAITNDITRFICDTDTLDETSTSSSSSLAVVEDNSIGIHEQVDDDSDDDDDYEDVQDTNSIISSSALSLSSAAAAASQAITTSSRHCATQAREQQLRAPSQNSCCRCCCRLDDGGGDNKLSLSCTCDATKQHHVHDEDEEEGPRDLVEHNIQEWEHQYCGTDYCVECIMTPMASYSITSSSCNSSCAASPATKKLQLGKHHHHHKHNQRGRSGEIRYYSNQQQQQQQQQQQPHQQQQQLQHHQRNVAKQFPVSSKTANLSERHRYRQHSECSSTSSLSTASSITSPASMSESASGHSIIAGSSSSNSSSLSLQRCRSKVAPASGRSSQCLVIRSAVSARRGSAQQQQQQQQPSRLILNPGLRAVPPPRPWLSVMPPSRRNMYRRLVESPNALCNTSPQDGDMNELRVVTYNILCDRLVNEKMFPDSPPIALDWNYRRALILNQLIELDADVVALQELEMAHYDTFFKPQLADLADYDSIFEPKSRAKTMNSPRRERVDGCAIFFKASKFRLVHRHLLEFNQLAMANAHGCEAMLNRVMTTDNIGLAAILEYVQQSDASSCSATSTDSDTATTQSDSSSGSSSSKPNTRILVCNTHIHWDPEYCDVKLVQTIMLMNELECIARHYATESNVDDSTPTKENNNRHKSSGMLPLVLLGDFNSLPSSGVSSYLLDGSIHSSHADFKNFKYADCTNSLAIGQHTNHYAYYQLEQRRKSTPAEWARMSEDEQKQQMHEDMHYERRSDANSIKPQRNSADNLRQQQTPVEYRHGFRLANAYEGDSILPYTNYTADFRGVIDYVYYTPGSLRVSGLLGPLDTKWMHAQRIRGLPQPHLPSDHLPLMVSFRLASSKPSTNSKDATTPTKQIAMPNGRRRNKWLDANGNRMVRQPRQHNNYNRQNNNNNNKSNSKTAKLNAAETESPRCAELRDDQRERDARARLLQPAVGVNAQSPSVTCGLNRRAYTTRKSTRACTENPNTKTNKANNLSAPQQQQQQQKLATNNTATTTVASACTNRARQPKRVHIKRRQSSQHARKCDTLFSNSCTPLSHQSSPLAKAAAATQPPPPTPQPKTTTTTVSSTARALTRITPQNDDNNNIIVINNNNNININKRTKD